MPSKQASLELSVDPGLNIGWALYPSGALKWPMPPLLAGTCKPTLGDNCSYLERALSAYDLFADTLDEHLPYVWQMNVEWPEFVKGDIDKVMFMVGMLSSWAHEASVQVVPVGVNEWKGQLKKKLVFKRLERLIGTLPGVDNHALDAVGIGLYKKGFSIVR